MAYPCESCSGRRGLGLIFDVHKNGGSPADDGGDVQIYGGGPIVDYVPGYIPPDGGTQDQPCPPGYERLYPGGDCVWIDPGYPLPPDNPFEPRPYTPGVTPEPTKTDTAPGQIPTGTSDGGGLPIDTNKPGPVDTASGHGILGVIVGLIISAALAGGK